MIARVSRRVGQLYYRRRPAWASRLPGLTVDYRRGRCYDSALPEPTEQQADQADPQVLHWRSHPLVDEYPKSIGLLAAIAVAATAATMAFNGLIYGLVAALLLCVSMASYLLPTTCTLDDEGAETRFMGQTQRLAWSQVRRVAKGRKGVFLSPRAEPSRVDSFRGLLLRFAGNADEVVSFVESRTDNIS